PTIADDRTHQRDDERATDDDPARHEQRAIGRPRVGALQPESLERRRHAKDPEAHDRRREHEREPRRELLGTTATVRGGGPATDRSADRRLVSLHQVPLEGRSSPESSSQGRPWSWAGGEGPLAKSSRPQGL